MTGAVSAKWWDRSQVKWAEKLKGCAPEAQVQTVFWRSFAVRSGEVGLLLGENEEQRQKGDYKMRVGGVKACSYTVEKDPGGKKPLLTLKN